MNGFRSQYSLRIWLVSTLLKRIIPPFIIFKSTFFALMSQSYGIDWQPVGYSVTMYDYIYSDGTKCSAKEAFPELFIK